MARVPMIRFRYGVRSAVQPSVQPSIATTIASVAAYVSAAATPARFRPRPLSDDEISCVRTGGLVDPPPQAKAKPKSA